jgi:hypothetical protein
MPPEKIDSLADDVKPLVLELLRQNSGLTVRVNELLAQNKPRPMALFLSWPAMTPAAASSRPASAERSMSRLSSDNRTSRR